MNYIKVIRMSGSFFAREFIKKEKARKNIKYREVDEKTVLEQFSKGSSTIEVVFEDMDRESIILSVESDPEIIKRYLGAKFLD